MKNKIGEMKVLNISQPAAHYVIFEGKNVENRSASCNFRGTIAIYASKTIRKENFISDFNEKKIRIDDCSFGRIIGFADVIDCITEDQVTKQTKKWFTGPYGYVLENIVALTNPIEVTPPQGAVLWWTVAGSQLDKCIQQLDQNRITPISKVTPVKGEIKKVPKTSGHAKLTPSKEIAQIIGADKTNLKGAMNRLFDYMDEHCQYEEDTKIIIFDSKIKKIFGKSNVKITELKDLVLTHLTV